MTKKLVVIGGGAAGFFCAINAAAANPALEVTIVEKTSKLLSKVKVSGGGRCNVTHGFFSIPEMSKNYPRGVKFVKKSFHHFFTTDTIEWFRKRNIKLKTEEDGRMFPESNSSQTIINCLVDEAKARGITILMNTEIVSLEITDELMDVNGRKTSSPFSLSCKSGAVLGADFVCIAAGGFSKKEQFQWLSKTGHSFEAPVPSLFTFNVPGNSIVKLMGITVQDVSIKINGTNYRQSGPLLITHWGFSGPAVLRLSAFAARTLSDMQYDFSITVNWLSTLNDNVVLEKLKTFTYDLAPQKIGNRNPFHLPQRLWSYLLEQCEIDEDWRWADLPAKPRNLLATQLCSQQFNVKGKTTFKEEFVTAGGINLGEINASTMESKIVPGLFFAGEILDVDGVTGGFNFQHAWTSGWLAADTISSRTRES